MQQAKSHSRSGQSLVEAMIAISLLLVGFLGTITLINRSVGLTRVVADSYVGTYLASEGIEIVKSLIDANYLAERSFNSGFETCTATCDWQVSYNTTWEENVPIADTGRTLIFDPVSGRYGYDSFGTDTNFKRSVKVLLGGPTGREITVLSRVEWLARGGGVSSVTVEDHFFDWYLSSDNATTTGTTTVPTP